MKRKTPPLDNFCDTCEASPCICVLNAVADVVLAYRPKSKRKKAKRRA